MCIRDSGCYLRGHGASCKVFSESRDFIKSAKYLKITAQHILRHPKQVSWCDTNEMHASIITAFRLMIVTLTFNFWPWKPFQVIPTHMMNICGRFHWNPYTQYRDIVSRKIAVNRQQPDGQHCHCPSVCCASAMYCWQQKHDIKSSAEAEGTNNTV